MILGFAIFGIGLGCLFGYLSATHFPIFDAFSMQIAEEGSKAYNQVMTKHIIIFGAIGLFLFIIIGLLVKINKNKELSQLKNQKANQENATNKNKGQEQKVEVIEEKKILKTNLKKGNDVKKTFENIDEPTLKEFQQTVIQNILNQSMPSFQLDKNQTELLARNNIQSVTHEQVVSMPVGNQVLLAKRLAFDLNLNDKAQDLAAIALYMNPDSSFTSETVKLILAIQSVETEQF